MKQNLFENGKKDKIICISDNAATLFIGVPNNLCTLLSVFLWSRLIDSLAPALHRVEGDEVDDLPDAG